MKRNTLLLLLLAGCQFGAFQLHAQVPGNRPDSAYIFAYATEKNSNHGGLNFAWSVNGNDWTPIGPEYNYVRSDYGRWGAEKRMIAPFLFQAPDGEWHCVWSLNEKDDAFAHASSKDLVYWGRQSYPVMKTGKNIISPVIAFDRAAKLFKVNWLSNGTNVYSTTTTDFKLYTQAQPASSANYKEDREEVLISGKKEKGTRHKVPMQLIEGLINARQLDAYNNLLNSEKTSDDKLRFASLKPVELSIIAEPSRLKKISDLLVGAFFEDINYAADGGLYAELIQNRDFEYDPADKEGHDKTWNSYKAWKINGGNATFSIDSIAPIHENNKHYAVLNMEKPGAALINEGFDGIELKATEKYNFSFFARTKNGRGGKILVRLVDKTGKVYGETVTSSITSSWKKYNLILSANSSVKDSRLELIPQFTGTVNLDMISLFPQQTFKQRKNGLRTDLAQAIADIKPRFLRFPGGCVAHGDGLANIYKWKNTIGPLEARKPLRNLWGYHQTAGLGYYEYFQFCEDMGAEPLPVLAAGVPCQNSATGGAGQQGGIPMAEMDEYIRDILDLVEWANGDPKTSRWAKLRAEAGHPKPFNLKYIGIGNEDLITDIFEERFTMIFNAIKAKHPEITVIGTAGPFYQGTDYVEGWNVVKKLQVPMVDEHYYVPPGWFIHNQDFYDKYDRNAAKVYLGEYASHLPGRPNNLETALTEALHLNSLEKNGDVVSMASYAPLLAKEDHTQWNPNLIYFNNSEVKLTTGYYIQQLYGLNAGNEYMPSAVRLSNSQDAVQKRISVSIVKDTGSKALIIKIVNLLPVTVSPTIDFSGMLIETEGVIKTELKGDPSDRNLKPVKSVISLNGNKLPEISPYSFTVFRTILK